MPYRTEHVQAEAVIRYNGHAIYHTYRDDEVSNGTWAFWYNIDPDQYDGGPEDFDVRELPEWKHTENIVNENARIIQTLKIAIDNRSIPNLPHIRCTICDWSGEQADLGEIKEDGVYKDPHCGPFLGKGCPNCKTAEYLRELP